MCRLKCESAIGSEERFDKEQYTEVGGGDQSALVYKQSGRCNIVR